MNALLYTLNEIHSQIPAEILNVAMNIDESPQTINLSSLDEKILRKIIRKRVMTDANLVGGIETVIPVGQLNPRFSEDNYTVYFVPDELTMGKEIISVLGLTMMPISYGAGIPASANGFGAPIDIQNPYSVNFNPMMQLADRIGNAASPYGAIYNAHTEIVARNTILVYAHYRLLATFGIRAVLENDTQLNNLQPRSYKNFSMLATLAVKAYIYNKLIVLMNSGMLSGGQDLGVFRSIVENYATAEEEYRTFLNEVWSAVAYMNDTTRYNRFIGSMLPGDL